MPYKNIRSLVQLMLMQNVAVKKGVSLSEPVRGLNLRT